MPAYLFIADDCGALRVVDPTSNEVVACVQVDYPAGMAIDCDLRKLYVANEQGTSLTVLNTSNLQGLNCIALQEYHNTYMTMQGELRSTRLAVNPNNHRVYIPQPGSGRLAVVNGFQDCLLDVVRVGGRPVVAAVNQRTNLVYVANHTNEIPVLNSNNNQVFACVSLPGDAGVKDVVVDNCDSRVYALREDGSVAVIDGATNTLIESICPPDGAAALAVDQSIGLLYFINAARNAVLVYDTCTLEQIGRLDIPRSVCRCLAQLVVNTQTHLVYISDPPANKTHVIDGGLNMPIAEIPAAGQSMALHSCTQNCPICMRR